MAIDEEHHSIAARRLLHRAVEEAVQVDPELEGSVVVGWALVAELATRDQGRWLIARSGDATGETDLTPWQAQGMTDYATGSGMFDAITFNPEGDAEVDDEDE